MSVRELSIDLLEHPARRAWIELSPGHGEPLAIDRLQKKKKAKVYRLRNAGPGGVDIVAKRASADRIEHERTIYEHILPSLAIPTAHYHGCLKDPDDESWWLFLEDAGGDAYSPISVEHRRLAAQWLARLHSSAAIRIAASWLPGRGSDFYFAHLRAAQELMRHSVSHLALTAHDVNVLAAIAAHCDLVASRWEEIASFCDAQPPTLVHGDFAPKNMRVRATTNGPVLIVFDWGSAGRGMAAPDLVQADTSTNQWSYWASPDLPTYRSIVQDWWPHADLRDIRRAAVMGQIFRCLVCISLTTASFAMEWIEVAMRNMTLYEAELAGAIRAAGWTAGGK